MLILSMTNQVPFCLFIAVWAWIICESFKYTYASPVSKISSSGSLNIKQDPVNLPTYEKQLEDEEVRQLQSLKPSVNLVSDTKLEEKVFPAKQNDHEQFKGQVDKSKDAGPLTNALQQLTDAKVHKATTDSPLETALLSQIEFPRRETGHATVQQSANFNSDDDDRRKSIFHRGFVISANVEKQDENLGDDGNAKNLALVPYTPFEMAEYISDTGDEKTVALAVKHFLQNGLLDREEAINYLQDIKLALNAIELQSIDELERRDKKDSSRGNLYEDVFEYPGSRMEAKQALADLKEIQKLLQNKYIKSFPADEFFSNGVPSSYGYHHERGGSDDDLVEMDNNYLADNEGKIRLSEKDGQALIEKLQLFENLFSEASMEEVIYELAKVLFSQSFTMGGFEAQDALKQFTTFLETQVEEGHISRNMERKVLDILISALADVLNEHPELVNGTRQKTHDEMDERLQQRKLKLNRFVLEKKNGLSTSLGKHVNLDLTKKLSADRFPSVSSSLNAVDRHRENTD